MPHPTTKTPSDLTHSPAMDKCPTCNQPSNGQFVPYYDPEPQYTVFEWIVLWFIILGCLSIIAFAIGHV